MPREFPYKGRYCYLYSDTEGLNKLETIPGGKNANPNPTSF